MSGYVNPDGSGLAGGLLPSGIGKALQLDALGNLKTVTQDQVRAAVLQGQVFSATTGNVFFNGGVAAVVAFALFNPANSGKNILIFSFNWFAGVYAGADLHAVTADPAFANAVTPNNQSLGGAASMIASHVSYANTNQARAGTELLTSNANTGTMTELLAGSDVPILLPNGSANGVVFYLGLSGNASWGANAVWIEF